VQVAPALAALATKKAAEVVRKARAVGRKRGVFIVGS
jgi:hypothetical protein